VGKIKHAGDDNKALSVIEAIDDRKLGHLVKDQSNEKCEAEPRVLECHRK
jgi:hypothetical protein